METYEYAITVYETDEILARVTASAAEDAPTMVYCGPDGLCFFDEAPNPYVAAMIEIFNSQGADGWALVQVVPRQQDLICFWRRSRVEE
jgi:hypothetical protein